MVQQMIGREAFLQYPKTSNLSIRNLKSLGAFFIVFKSRSFLFMIPSDPCLLVYMSYVLTNTLEGESTFPGLNLRLEFFGSKNIYETWATLGEDYKAYVISPKHWIIVIQKFWWFNSASQTAKPDLPHQPWKRYVVGYKTGHV